MNPFNLDATTKLSKNKFDKSHEVKMTARFGRLYPVLTEQVYPGDSYRCQSEIFARTAPMLAPLMHRVDVWTHSFYVPYRLLWDNWPEFIKDTEGVSPPEHPKVTYNESFKGRFVKGELIDYMGFPCTPDATHTVTGELTVNSLWLKAYQLIYNEWFRDQDLFQEVDIRKTVDGIDDQSQFFQFRNRSWEKDYFTSARERAQKGLPVRFGAADPDWLKSISGANISNSGTFEAVNPDTNDTTGMGDRTTGEAVVPNILISDVRRAEAVQKFLEQMQRAGDRYKEYLAGIWGVNYQAIDSRIDIPEFLSGNKTPIQISEVLSTAQESATSTAKLGELGGHGLGVGSSHGFKGSFPEHGVVMTILSILPKTAYQDGLHRNWRKFTKFDYYTPQLALIGEQEVKNRELYFDKNSPNSVSQSDTFGYQVRYSEEKYCNDRVAGDFRDTLNFWHLGRQFASLPSLNNDFITCDVTRDNLNRIFNVESSELDNFWIQIYHKIDAIRPMLYTVRPTI